MKPVYCGEIALGERKDSVSAPQGSARDWSGFSGVFLVVTSQRQLGIRRKLPFPPVFGALNSEGLVWSLISTEDCVRILT